MQTVYQQNGDSLVLSAAGLSTVETISKEGCSKNIANGLEYCVYDKKGIRYFLTEENGEIMANGKKLDEFFKDRNTAEAIPEKYSGKSKLEVKPKPKKK